MKPRTLHPLPFTVQPMDVSDFAKPTELYPESVTEEAQRITSADRNAAYGHPLDNHQCTADLLTVWLRRKYGAAVPQLTAEDICTFNMMQKLSREAHAPKRDNLVDICGYARNAVVIAQRRAQKAL